MKSLLFVLALSVPAHAAQNSCGQFMVTAKSGKATARFKRFLDVQWKYNMTESPEWATFVGYPGLNDRLSDNSIPAIKRRKTETHCQLEALHKIPRQALNDKDRVTYDLAVRDATMAIEGEKFGTEYIPISHMNGIQVDTVDLFSAMPVATKEDYKNILVRMDKLPLAIDQTITLLREGLKRNLTPTKMFLPKISAEIDSLLPVKIEDSPLYKPFAEMTLSKAEQAPLQAQARAALESKVYPAFRKLQTFVNQEYTPLAHDYISWSEMPNGKAWYAFLVKTHTTTSLNPDQLHEIGVREVARITNEMTKIKDAVKFKGDLKAFNKVLLTDKQFYFTDPNDLIVAYRDITKRIDPELTKMFRTLPRLTYGVRAVPEFRASSTSAAEYQGGSLDAGRAGWFQANTFDLKSRPKWEMETLAFHEGVPGHHFQISVAQEIADLPEFRKFGGNTAFVEGWALYAESLGEEMGFYKDPYSKYGHYSDEILRAVRLVVDTGMHAKGWTRQQALDYFRSKMPVSDVDSEIEINRYITWPGQALAYKVGQLKFRELRERAHLALGENFDVRAYHDLVLGQGSLPMEVLEKVVDAWILKQKPASKRVSQNI